MTQDAGWGTVSEVQDVAGWRQAAATANAGGESYDGADDEGEDWAEAVVPSQVSASTGDAQWDAEDADMQRDNADAQWDAEDADAEWDDDASPVTGEESVQQTPAVQQTPTVQHAFEPEPVDGTGHPAVDAAVRAVDNAQSLPVAEQLAAYEGAHQTLREVLASIED